MTNISYWKILTRKKVLPNDGDVEQSSKLGRVLGTYDLAALGIGATLGVGVYVLAGHVSRDQAGPSVILSFLIAAAASFLAGLCYSEFGARVPKSGSAYIYSYVCIGEFIAFVIGWTLLLEYIIGSASVAKGLSLYLDTLLHDTLKNSFTTIAPLPGGFLAEYFDFFSFTCPLLLGVAMAFGLKKSTIINNVFTLLNIFIVLFVIIAGAFKADLANWTINPNDPGIPPEANVGSGGFFPFGISGTLRGAATCFFGYVGFDCIATTGEEVQNPKKAIPMAILISLFTIFMAYFGVSTVLTLMYPYYLQDVNAPLPHVFNEIGWIGAKWVVAIGGIFGLIASLFGAMFPLPRIIYAIAQDGLIFRVLGKVNEKFQTPVIGTICAAFLTGSFSALFDLKALVNMLSIGTLMAYTVVAISILILRFSNNLDNDLPPAYSDTNSNTVNETTGLSKSVQRLTLGSFFVQFFNFKRIQRPNSHSMKVAAILVGLYCVSALGLALTIYFGATDIGNLEPYALTLLSIFLFLTILFLIALSVQPRERTPDAFTVPLVPILPGISIFINLFLMLMLDYYTWIRFAVWMLIGLPMYCICVCCTEPDDDVLEEVKHIDYTIQLNGTLNRAYQAEYDNYVEHLNHSPNALTFREQIETTVDDLLRDAVEAAELQQTAATSTSHTPPSPTQSYDEIIPESELVDHPLTEKRAGNGSRYYTDEPLNDIEPEVEDDHDGDSDKAIAILDDVLENEEKYSDISRASSLSIRDQVATAIVHHAKDESRRTSANPQDLQKPVFGVIDESDKKQLIDKLNTLFKQKTLPNRLSKVEFEDEITSVSTESRKRPSLKQSKTVVGSMSLLTPTSVRENRSMSPPPSNHDPTDDEIVKDTQPPTDTPTDTNNNKIPEVTSSSNIPEPPPFKPDVYYSLPNKSHHLTPTRTITEETDSPTEDINSTSDDNDPVKASKYPSGKSKIEINHLQKSSITPPLRDSQETTDDQAVEPVDIRKKLEQIFSQRISEVVNKPPVTPILNNNIELPDIEESVTPESVISPERNGSLESTLERPNSFREKAKKFDTVEKQKALFSNVLKELSPAGSNNLKRVSSNSNRLSASQVFDFNNINGSVNDVTSA